MASLPVWFPPTCEDATCKQPHRIDLQGHLHEGQLYTQIIGRTVNQRGKINLHVKAYYCFSPEKSAQLKERILSLHRKPKEVSLKETEEISRDFHFSNEDYAKVLEDDQQKLVHGKVFKTLQMLYSIG